MRTDKDHWWLSVYRDLNEATDDRDLFRRAQRFALDLGFAFCCYGLRIPTSVMAPQIRVFDSYPSGWMDHYTEQNYLSVDPTARPSVAGSAPMVWSDQLFAGAPELWADAKAAGLRFGVAQRCWSARNAYGVFSLARDAEPLTESELAPLRPCLRWLADATHQRMNELLSTRSAPLPAEQLSPREREVLSWTADGKTSWEIAQILYIAESTVNFHVKKIISKLQVQNKIQAAAKATALGILYAE